MLSNNNDDTFNENTCVVCFKNVDLFSVGDCDHPVCYECSTRMRVLCRQNECPICRHDMQKVIFTKFVRPFKQLERTLGPRTSFDRKFQIVFENAHTQAAYDALLAHICPKCPTRHAFQTFNLLREHVRKEHELFYCDLCVDNLKILTKERKCYTRRDLGIHRRQGDPDDRSHRGHPLCEFCDLRYNDNDELYRHLRRDHLFCHFCDADGLHQYYDSYDVLRNHFRDQHYLCEEGECYDEKFTSAFRTEIDLKAHIASVHGRQMTKAAAKQARTLELAFTLKPRPRQMDHKRGGRGPSRYQSHSDEEEGAVGGLAVDYRHPSQQTTSTPSFSKINTASNDEFPSLGGSATTPSIQGVHFRKPGVTVRAGPSGGLAITDEDFPALGPEATTSVSLRVNTNSGNAAERAKSKPTNVSIHVNHRPNSVVTTVSRPRDPFPALGNDFPALSSKASSQPSVTASQWMARESRDSEPKFSVKTKQSSSQPQQKTQQKNSKNFDEDTFVQNNFPALGGNVPSHIANLAATQWSSGRELEPKVSVNKNKSNQPPPKLPQPKTFHIEDDFPSLKTFSSRFGASCNTSDTRSSEMKKKKESSISIPVDNDWSKVGKGSANLDTVSGDSEVGSKKGNKKKKNKSKGKKESGEPSNNNNNESNKKKKQKEESKPKNKQVKVEEQLGTTSSKNGEAVEKKNSIEVERKCSELKIESLNGHSQLENKIDLKDFPSLSSSRLPPGFYSGEKPQAPPGFESTTGPPPGFSITLNSVARPPSNGLTFTSSSGQNYPITPGKIDRVFSYVPPANVKWRNPELVQKVTDGLKTKEALDEFLEMSGLFRNGTLDAETYYNHCKSAMGDAAFAEIFPELLVLLPDIDKQQELWRVAERRKQWKLQVCAVCSQVVAAADFKHHHMTHSLETQFPALSNGLYSPTFSWNK